MYDFGSGAPREARALRAGDAPEPGWERVRVFELGEGAVGGEEGLLRDVEGEVAVLEQAVGEAEHEVLVAANDLGEGVGTHPARCRGGACPLDERAQTLRDRGGPPVGRDAPAASIVRGSGDHACQEPSGPEKVPSAVARRRKLASETRRSGLTTDPGQRVLLAFSANADQPAGGTDIGRHEPTEVQATTWKAEWIRPRADRRQRPGGRSRSWPVGRCRGSLRR